MCGQVTAGNGLCDGEDGSKNSSELLSLSGEEGSAMGRKGAATAMSANKEYQPLIFAMITTGLSVPMQPSCPTSIKMPRAGFVPLS